jgi:hypothetical protein
MLAEKGSRGSNMNWFRNSKPNKPPTQSKADYNMHILALDGSSVNAFVSKGNSPPVNVYSCHLEGVVTENTEFIIPALTTDGRISFLSAGKNNDLRKLQQLVSARFAPMVGQLSSMGVSGISIGNFTVVGVAFHLPDVPDMSYLVFRTLVFPKPLPELEQIYSLLKAYSVGEENTRIQIQSYFRTDLQKKWINDVIAVWKQKMNWTDIVDTEIRETKSSH